MAWEGTMNNESLAIRRIKDSNIICINGEINDDLACVFNITLLSMEYENPNEDVTIYINSPGGSVTAGLSMIDTMNLISCDVRTVCTGMAASMAALILMAGTKGKRRILPHSKVLIHQPLGSFGQGFKQATDVEIAARELTRTKEELYQLMVECTGQSFERISHDCERDYTLTAQEALEYNIVDEIIKSHKSGN